MPKLFKSSLIENSNSPLSEFMKDAFDKASFRKGAFHLNLQDIKVKSNMKSEFLFLFIWHYLSILINF